jgi:flagellar motor protein MotB
MRRQIAYSHDEDLNVFQAFTDLMSNAFIIITFFLLISLLQSASISEKLSSASPIIINEKSGNFKFSSGSAQLTKDLQKYIETTVAPEIKQVAKGNIDFIQVIGHTDSQSVSNTSSLDEGLTLAAIGTKKIDSLKAGSNADLGLMRAVAVVQLLQQTKGLEKVNFRAYSAGQLYLPSGKLAPVAQGADDVRRRIEIRFIPFGQTK